MALPEKPKMPELLVASRMIQTVAASAKDTQTMKDLRELKKHNSGQFLTQWSNLEKEYQKNMAAWTKEIGSKMKTRKRKAPESQDPGTEKSLNLVHKLLEHYGAKEGKGL